MISGHCRNPVHGFLDSGIGVVSALEETGHFLRSLLEVVVITLKQVAKGGGGVFVGVAVPVADDFRVGTVWVHSHGESGSPDEAVVAFLATYCGVVDWPYTAAVLVVGSAPTECFTGLIGEDGAAVAVVEVPFSVGAGGD